MTRTGREPSEDLVRRIKAAYEGAGLCVHHRFNRLWKERQIRMIAVGASRPGWDYECLMLDEIQTVMDLGGNLAEIEFRCAATDGDPVLTALASPTLREATAGLDELAAATINNAGSRRGHMWHESGRKSALRGTELEIGVVRTAERSDCMIAPPAVTPLPSPHAPLAPAPRVPPPTRDRDHHRGDRLVYLALRPPLD